MRSDLTILTVGPRLLEARLQRGSSVLWSGQVEYHSTADLAEAIARLVAEPDLIKPGKSLLVELERPVVQLRTLNDIPPVRAGLVRQAVEQQEHRYFRKNGVPLVLDAVRIGRRGHHPVLAAATEEPVIAAIVEGAQAGGFQLQDVRPLEWRNRGLSLLPSAERERRFRLARLSLRRTVIVVVLLWLMVTAIGVASHMRQLQAVNREIATLARPVAALREARHQLALARETIAVLDHQQGNRTRVVALMSAIAGALPDSSFLTSLTLESDGSGRITGYASRASEVLARLDAAQVVTAPVLESQQARQPIGGRDMEAFSIRFGTKGDLEELT